MAVMESLAITLHLGVNPILWLATGRYKTERFGLTEGRLRGVPKVLIEFIKQVANRHIEACCECFQRFKGDVALLAFNVADDRSVQAC